MRRLARTANAGGDDDKPTLEGVLTHYGVEFSPHRLTQMVGCPLHEDGNPSCSVNLDREVWRCHSCGEGGDAITLIELKEEVNYHGARSYAAAQSLPTGSTGGSSSELRVGRYGRRSGVAQRKGRGSGDGGYVPSWRGRR